MALPSSYHVVQLPVKGGDGIGSAGGGEIGIVEAGEGHGHGGEATVEAATLQLPDSTDELKPQAVLPFSQPPKKQLKSGACGI